MAKPRKAEKKAKKAKKKAARADGAARLRKDDSALPARQPEARPALDDEAGSFTLEQVAEVLGPPDAQLERALRAGHSDAELQKEGAKVASERILADGQRLCSKALVHLTSHEPDVALAARKAGLTRGMLALTADALLRLSGVSTTLEASAGKKSRGKRAATVTIESATARGRALKRQVLERLELLRPLDAELSALVEQASASADSPSSLASQLGSLSSLIDGLSKHKRPEVRLIAEHKGLGGDDAGELSQAAAEIEGALKSRSSGDARHEEHQAVLDVLDGLCLLLLDDVLRALRAMTRMTSKVRRPQLHALATYFGARGGDDASPPDQPPAPTPS